MRLKIRVIPNAKRRRVEREGEKIKVYVCSLPERGKANRELIEALSEHFKVKKSSVKIVSGAASREKVIEIDE